LPNVSTAASDRLGELPKPAPPALSTINPATTWGSRPARPTRLPSTAVKTVNTRQTQPTAEPGSLPAFTKPAAGLPAAAPTPTTAFQTAPFQQSIAKSLSSLATRSTMPAMAATQYKLEPFNETIENTLVAAARTKDPVEIPATRYDAHRFHQAVESSLAFPDRSLAAPARRVTAFDDARFAQTVKASLPPAFVPQTVFDAKRFEESVSKTIAQGGMPTIREVPATAFNARRFDRSIAASLAAFGTANDPIVSSEMRKKKAATWPTEHCAPCQPLSDFSPTPIDPPSLIHNEAREALPYDAKSSVPTQYPWVQLWREYYGDGITPPGLNLFGEKNLVRPELYVYGDFRTAVCAGRNAVGRTDNWANRLNLDVDFQITDTERFHAFVGPLDEDNQFTRLQLVDGDLQYRQAIDITPVTAFFEGDLGVLLGTAFDRTSPVELPFTIGLVPLLFQNGIWMEDAVTGAAFALPARHSRLLNWSNYDASFFAVFDQLNSVAFGADEHAAQAFGTAWFIEAYGGYIESGYAYVRDRNRSELSYHNITTSFTRRYFDRISNSVRVIVNAGQDLPKSDRTADGVLLLVENSWITQWPLTVVPYANFFVGWDRPQSVGRAAVAGQILRNTGINFDTDGVNGFATLDASGNGTAGFSWGIDLIGDSLERQLLLEFAYLSPNGGTNAAVPGDQYAIGSRYQFPISNWSLLRFDAMYGWRGGLENVYGTRMEYRWKF
jgi:hypothetical protein